MQRSKGFGDWTGRSPHWRRMTTVYWAWRRPLWGWIVLGLLIGITLGLGLYGYIFGKFPVHWTTALYRVLLLFALNNGEAAGDVHWSINLARWAGAGVWSVTIATVLLKLFASRALRIFTRVFAHGHVVIAGLGRDGHLLVLKLLERGEDVVVIDPRESEANLEVCRNAGAVVLVGDPASQEMLYHAQLLRATRLLVLFLPDEETLRVITAAFEIHNLAAGLPRSKARELQCVAKLETPELAPLAARHDMTTSGRDRFTLTTLPTNRIAAGTMLDLARGQTNLVTLRRVLVYGPGRSDALTQSLVFALIRDAVNGAALEIHLYGEQLHGGNATNFADRLRRRYPKLDQQCKLVAYPPTATYPTGRFDAVFVCLDDFPFATAEVESLVTQMRDTPVVAVVETAESGLGKLFARRPQQDTGSQLFAVSLQDAALDPEMAMFPTNEILARATHESYLRKVRGELADLRAQNKTAEADEKAAQSANQAWTFLHPELRFDNRAQVHSWKRLLWEVHSKMKPSRYRIIKRDAVPTSSASITKFTTDEIEFLAELEHNRWMAIKIANGWKYGPEKNAMLKTHPCIVPYADLTESFKENDRVVYRELPDKLDRAGYVIVKVTEPVAVTDGRP